LSSRSGPRVVHRHRGVWRLVLPEDRDHAPAAAIVRELDAVDAPHEGLRVVGGPARLVGREDLDHVAELVGPTADLPLEEAVLLETRAGAADVLVDAPGQPDTGAIGPLARRHQPAVGDEQGTHPGPIALSTRGARDGLVQRGEDTVDGRDIFRARRRGFLGW